MRVNVSLLALITGLTVVGLFPSVGAIAGIGTLGVPGAGTPDLLVQSKVDQVWSTYLIERLRKLLANTEVQDPFKAKISDKTLSSAILPGDLDADQKEFFSELAEAMHMSLDESRIKVVTKGLSYQVGTITPDIDLHGVQADLALSFSDVKVDAREVELSLVVAPEDGSAPYDFIKVSLLGPSVHVDASAVLDFTCRLEPVIGDEKMSFKVRGSSFGSVSEFLVKNGEKVTIDTGELSMEPITVQAGPKVHVINAEKVSKILKKNRAVIKKVILSQFTEALTTGLGDDFLKLIFDQPYDTELWLPSHVYSRVKVDAIHDAHSDQMSIELSGSFCGADDYKKYGADCEKYEKFWPDVRPISADKLAWSKHQMTDALLAKDANMVASASEQYVNRLIRKTIEMGLWNDMLPPGAAIGPLGGFVLLDEPGTSFNFYMDLLYTGTKMDKIAIGKKTLRLPLSLKISMKIVNHDVAGKLVPAISFVVHSADTSTVFLKKGLPEYGLESDLSHVRFKKKIAAAMTKALSPYYEKEVLKIDFPVLTGLGLDQALFESDGHGRALVKLQVGPLLQ